MGVLIYVDICIYTYILVRPKQLGWSISTCVEISWMIAVLLKWACIPIHFFRPIPTTFVPPSSLMSSDMLHVMWLASFGFSTLHGLLPYLPSFHWHRVMSNLVVWLVSMSFFLYVVIPVFTVHFVTLHSFLSPIAPCTCTLAFMSASFQSLLAPYEALIEFRAKLTQCRHSLQVLADAVPEILPDAKEWINMSLGLLDRIEPQLRRTEYQMLCIPQLQLHHTLEQLGHLPTIEADWLCVFNAYPTVRAQHWLKMLNPTCQKQERLRSAYMLLILVLEPSHIEK